MLKVKYRMKRTKKTPYKKYTSHQMHELLCQKLLSREYRDGKYAVDPSNQQAEFCPYYVPLTGDLKTDWGVIVNPESPKFGQVVFEHDGCECPNHAGQHGNFRGTSWLYVSAKRESFPL